MSQQQPVSSNDAARSQVTLWADRIRPHLAAVAENIIRAGRDLITAKAELQHGEFFALVESLGLKPRTAQKFMARHELIGNAPPGAHLPTGWTTLYELSQAPGDLLERAITDGEVTPDMSKKDAAQLVARLKEEHTRETSAREQTARIRKAQWELGQAAAAYVQAGFDITSTNEMMVSDVPPGWEWFGYDTPAAWLGDLVGLLLLLPEPDFTRPWTEQLEQPSSTSSSSPSSPSQ